MDTTLTLQQLGFTEYEARAYAALVAGGEMNGYELAKKTGIPRANIYAVAARLVERGAVLPAEHAGGRRYVALAPEPLLRSLQAQHQRALQAARQAFERRGSGAESVAVLNLQGQEFLAHARQLIDACQHRLLLALHPEAAAFLADALRMADERGVHMATLCLAACDAACGACQGVVYRRAVATETGSDRLILVADDETAVIGQVHGVGGQARASHGLTTRQPAVVQLAADFIRQQLLLATLSQALGSRIDTLMSEPDVQALAALYPDGGLPANLSGLSAPASRVDDGTAAFSEGASS
ncbi:TrmB family transcriptional regulator [Castellaniella sp.]|uniref:TrmB family transcriptional regulator n=1 Tax=Castellaniella sp. TaxID=1955812 RepID=UPI003566EACF